MKKTFLTLMLSVSAFGFAFSQTGTDKTGTVVGEKIIRNENSHAKVFLIKEDDSNVIVETNPTSIQLILGDTVTYTLLIKIPGTTKAVNLGRPQ